MIEDAMSRLASGAHQRHCHYDALMRRRRLPQPNRPSLSSVLWMLLVLGAVLWLIYSQFSWGP
jgi:hypothetical protein